MRAELSPAIERAIAQAEPHRLRLGTHHPGPVALLLGLLHEDEGQAADLFAQFGLPLLIARQTLEAVPAEPLADLPLILRDTRVLVREHSEDPTLSSEFFLVALLDADEGVRDVLGKVGLNVDRLRERITGTIKEALPLDGDLLTIPPVEQVAAGRILDVNANRALESLRLIDDYCRFVLNDAVLTGLVKGLRHELAGLLEHLPRFLLLHARDTPHDVGTTVTAPGEMYRENPAAIVRINVKRLQEALRSLEEYSKIIDPFLAGALEKMRYRAYSLEKTLLHSMAVRERLAGVNLYLLLTRRGAMTSADWMIPEAVGGGVGIVQLREKDMTDRELLARAREIRGHCRRAGCLFIVNDRPDIAIASEADGVHLGQDDLPISQVRRMMGHRALIGVSTHSPEQVREAVESGADYIGMGPTFPSTTKSFQEYPGSELIRRAMQMTSIPAFAIGGITSANLPQVLAAGGTRVAVSAAIVQSEEPRREAAILSLMLKGAKAEG